MNLLLDNIFLIFKKLILFPIRLLFKIWLKPSRVVFYHIPRSGGRSLYKFYDFYINEKIYCKNDYETFKSVKFKFSHVVRKIHKKESKNTRYLIIIRKPFDRMVSRYFYLKNYAIRSDEKSNIVQKNQLSFEEYLDWLWLYGNDNLLVRMITGKISKDMIIENKHKLKKFKKKIIRVNSKDVELAKKILKNFDVVMFENINTFNWTKYFTNLSISFPFFNINNFLYYNKINYKRKYFKYMKYDYELYRYFLNKTKK